MQAIGTTSLFHLEINRYRLHKLKTKHIHFEVYAATVHKMFINCIVTVIVNIELHTHCVSIGVLMCM